MDVPPLVVACHQRDVATVERLLAAGEDVNAGYYDDETPLRVALRAAQNAEADGNRRPSTELARALLDGGAEVVDDKGSVLAIASGLKSPLAIASGLESGRLLSLLLRRRPSIEFTGVALAAACARGREANVRRLLKARADPNDGEGRAVRAAVFGRSRLSCLKLLLKAGATVGHAGILCDAASCKSLRPLKLLLRHGAAEHPAAFSRIQQSYGNDSDDDEGVAEATTAMNEAIHHGNVRAVQLLSAYGAPRSLAYEPAPGFQAETTIDDALCFMPRNLQEAKARLREWLDRTATWTRLHHLEQLSEAETRRLLRSGADVERADATGATPVSRARMIEQQGAANGAVRLVLQAAAPWSTHSHHLFGDADRRFVVEVLGVAYAALAHSSPYALPIDIWRALLLPRIVRVRRTPRS